MCRDRSKYRTLKWTSKILKVRLLPANSIEKDIKWFEKCAENKKTNQNEKFAKPFTWSFTAMKKMNTHKRWVSIYYSDVYVCILFWALFSVENQFPKLYILAVFSPLVGRTDYQFHAFWNADGFFLHRCFIFHFILLVQSHIKARFFCSISSFKSFIK